MSDSNNLKKDIEMLPPLREVIALSSLNAQKKFGQNFILDLNLTRKIARSAGNLSDSTIIEIGPGPGGLTRALFLEGANRVVAIEKDPRCFAVLEGLKEIAGDQFQLIEGDALKIDYAALTKGSTKIIANLPYNVSTPLLIHWLKHMDLFDSLTLLFQKEVAERIVAKPKTEFYGRLSVIAQLCSTPEIVFDIPPQAFVPAPKVTSTLVHFKKAETKLSLEWIQKLEYVTQLAFAQRRKMLRVSLKALMPSISSFLEHLGINPEHRAEDLSPQDFVKIVSFFRETPI